jgi:hypothetical protein
MHPIFHCIATHHDIRGYINVCLLSVNSPCLGHWSIADGVLVPSLWESRITGLFQIQAAKQLAVRRRRRSIKYLKQICWRGFNCSILCNWETLVSNSSSSTVASMLHTQLLLSQAWIVKEMESRTSSGFEAREIWPPISIGHELWCSTQT